MVVVAVVLLLFPYFQSVCVCVSVRSAVLIWQNSSHHPLSFFLSITRLAIVIFTSEGFLETKNLPVKTIIIIITASSNYSSNTNKPTGQTGPNHRAWTRKSTANKQAEETSFERKKPPKYRKRSRSTVARIANHSPRLYAHTVCVCFVQFFAEVAENFAPVTLLKVQQQLQQLLLPLDQGDW